MKTITICLSAALLIAFYSPGFSQVKFPKNIYEFIENPAIFEANQEPGHVPMVIYNHTEKALKGLKTDSPNYLSLNGNWKFNYAENPSEAPADFFLAGYADKKWASIKVPGNWEMQGYGDPMFRNVNQPFKANPPFVPHEYNPVGSYRTTFDLPANWTGKQVFLRMDGSTSATFVWLNGKEVGYNQGANEPAEYNLTSFLKSGKNAIAVQVYKYSDGTYLEDQDFWRLSGIFRDVYLTATPQVHILDYYLTTDLDAQYKDAHLYLTAFLKNYLTDPKAGLKVRITAYDNKQNLVNKPIVSEVDNLTGKANKEVKFDLPFTNPQKWSAEKPNLYHLTIELLSNEGTVIEVVATKFGFKKTEFKNRAMYVNGKVVKLNGVNSHMQHPTLGHAMDTSTIRKDFILMKRFNINCVRTSHYPPVQEYLEMADELGIYIVDETGDESHATEYISEKPEWRNAYVERVEKMVLRDRNHPSIIFWSAGNESGSGNNICEVIKAGKKLDPTRRWMYGGNTNDIDWKNEVPCEEIIGPRYPTPYELETRIAQVPESQDPRPSFMDEYVATTGNGAGGLDEFWALVYKYPRLIGGAIWDWISPGINEKIRLIKDESPNQVQTAIKGRATLVAGKFGKAIQLNGHDQWVETYSDPSLDITGKTITLSLWVLPNQWNGNGTLLVKGDYQFGIVQPGEGSLEFYVTSRQKKSITGKLPQNWTGSWHHLAATCDGNKMVLYIDGKVVASDSFTEAITNKPFPVTIGYSAENEGSEYSKNMNNSLFDRVAIYHEAIPVERLMLEDTPEIRKSASLWLDFENEEVKGEYFSLGIGGRTYGMVWPDRKPQPELWQVKKSAQPVAITWKDASNGVIELTNRFAFTNLDELQTIWQLEGDGEILQQGELPISLNGGDKTEVKVPFVKPEIKAGISYRLLVSCRTKEDKFWAKRGYEMAWEQLSLPWVKLKTIEVQPDNKPLVVNDLINKLSISGSDFSYIFDKQTGDLTSLQYQNRELINYGPVLNVWRAPLVNETDPWANGGSQLRERQPGMGNGPVNNWYSLGINQLKFTLDQMSWSKNDQREVIVKIENHGEGSSYKTAFTNSLTYTINTDGQLRIAHTIIPHGIMPLWLPRIGMKWLLPSSFELAKWNGRGPFENYPDRKTGAKLGVYEMPVSDFNEPYLKPQDFGCRTDNKWVIFQNKEGIGLEFKADESFNFSAQQYDTDHLTRAQYPYQLKLSDQITFNFDYATSGVGCTAISVLNEYRVLPKVYYFVSYIQPFNLKKQIIM